jgi:hypothetical protein
MSRISAHLTAIETWLKVLPHAGAPIVTEVKRQLDLVDAEDVAKLSFKSPGGFLVLPRFRLVERADGGRDAEIWIVIAIAVTARAGASADADVIDRAITLAASLDGQLFGQLKTSRIAAIECRPVLQAALEAKGMAIAAVSFQQLLFDVVPPPAATMGLVGATGVGGPRPGDPDEYLANDGELTPDEQAIVDGWSGGAP